MEREGLIEDGEGGSLLVRCPAKVNLFLEVVRRREDGYHDLDTVMQAVDLCDELRISPLEGPELSLVCRNSPLNTPTTRNLPPWTRDPRPENREPKAKKETANRANLRESGEVGSHGDGAGGAVVGLPVDGRNLVVRAALALRAHTGCKKGAHFALVKRIPMQSGLGGGSSDAAAALLGLNAAWGLGLTTEELRGVAATIGSDVAFFLYGGTARCTGRGEVVEPLVAPAVFHYVVVCPPVGVPTADAYARLRLPLTSPRASASMLAESLAQGSVEAVGRRLFNRLEAAAFELRPELREVKRRLAGVELVAGVGMTGSGSAFFGLCRPGDWGRACAAAEALGIGRVFAARSFAPRGAGSGA